MRSEGCGSLRTALTSFFFGGGCLDGVLQSAGRSCVIPPRSPHGAKSLRLRSRPRGSAPPAAFTVGHREPRPPLTRGGRDPLRAALRPGSPLCLARRPTRGSPSHGAESGVPAPALPWCPAAGAGGPCPPSRRAARPGSSRSSSGRIPSLRCEPAAARPARVRSRRPRLAPSLRPAPLPGRPCRLGQGNEPQSPGVSAERHRQQAALPPAGLE